MAALVLEGVSDQIVTAYSHASYEAKQQLNKVLEDVLQLWTSRSSEEANEENLRQEMLEFITHLPTFPLDWQQHKMTREEMNAR